MTTQLPQILVKNSFNILGLSSSSALKEIRRRSQQLLQLAKIEEIQEFDTDIGHVKEFRNESEIRQALERVSGIQERLKEIFFWFEDHSIESRKGIELISKGSYQQALDIFEKAEDVRTDWLGRKNLALAFMFQAFAQSNLRSFYRSLDLWKLIFCSDEFWKFYQKHYLLQDELGTASSLFEQFRNSLYETIWAKAVSFYHQTKNPEAIGACYSVCGSIGKTADIEILQPVILNVKKETEELEKIATIPAVEVITCLTLLHGYDVPPPQHEIDKIDLMKLENIKTSLKSDSYISLIQRMLNKIHDYFLFLDKFKLSGYSPLIILKNDTAEKYRSIAVAIYNQNVDIETARLFLNQSSRLAVSEAILNKIETDKRQLKENESWQPVSKRFEAIKLLIEIQQFNQAKRAYIKLDNDLAEEAAESAVSNRIQLMINYCSILMEKGHELFDKKKFGIKILAICGLLNRKNQKDGVFAFEQASEILKDRLYLLKFLDPVSGRTKLLKTVDSISSNLRNAELESLFNLHQSYLETIENTALQQPNEKTQIGIKLLGGAVCFSILYYRFHRITQRKMWKWIGLGAVIFIYFLAIVDNDNSAPKPSSKESSYQSTSDDSSSSQEMNYEEQAVFEYLQENAPEFIEKARNAGYSDKEIAQYIIEHEGDKEK